MWYDICAVLFVAGWAWACGAQAADKLHAAPLSIPPSEYFDGDDGLWSSFQIQVGTPGQTVRLLPGTSASAGDVIWVVLPEGCTEANPDLANCANERGYTFTRNESSTWSTERLSNGGLFQLNTFEESYLGLTGNAYYGFDTVSLGLNGTGLPVLQNQIVAGLATNNYWLGSLGLSPIPFNITNLDDFIPSLLENLRNSSIVPSLSWAYTAGASYQDFPVYGSLTFGGFDTTRFDQNNTLADIAFGADFSRDLLLQLREITHDTIGSSPLLTQTIDVFIDSMVSHLWLPIEVCQGFEKAFNLTWNSTAELYLMDEDVHTALVAQNPTFTFSLTPNSTSSESVDIVIPYAAFDLLVTQPAIQSGATAYFPLKRAQNSSQYTLGRVFLQEAYVIADYERQRFSVSQALFPSRSTPQQLVAIYPLGFKAKGEILSKGAIAGIVIGSVVAVGALVAILVWHRRRRLHKQGDAALSAVPDVDETKREQPGQQSKGLLQGAELDGQARYEMDPSNGLKPELASDGLLPNKTVHEIGAAEMHRHEMGTSEVAAVELEAPTK